MMEAYMKISDCVKRGFVVFVLVLWPFVYSDGRDTLRVVFWNLENFFDYFDGGGGESDSGFSSLGERKWTRRRFYAKCDAVAKGLLWIADRYGGMPDAVGLAEIENAFVLRKLLESTPLRKFGYRIVHSDSPDRRGIDVALLYRKSSFELQSAAFIVPEYMGEKMATRHILHARVKSAGGRVFDMAVNHHPSTFGGEAASRGRREAAMHALGALCDSLISAGGSDGVIAMGDFNDTPDGEQFGIIEGLLCNKSSGLHAAGEGTIRYEGKWDLIDMFMVSPWLDEYSVMEICRIPFLMVRDRKHPGEKPLRTYSGPRYIGGVSDHCPIVLEIR